MKSTARIIVGSPNGEYLNGLGKMMIQYLEQNFTDFAHKTKQALGIRGRVVVEVEKGIAITIFFEGERIRIENGISSCPDLHLISSYSILANVLSAKANPLIEFIRGNIKLASFLKRPVQALKILRFLQIPSELVIK